MATTYKYSILITFAHPNPDLAAIQSKPVPYIGTRTDTFRFNAQSIRIYANRTERVNDSNIDLYQKLNVINRQIYKAIELYYVTCPEYTHVRSIYLRVKTNSKKSRYYDYTTSNTFTQPLPRNIKGSNAWQFSPNKVLPLIGLDVKANAYKIALSYCLKSATENTDFAKFSNLWRAFNAIYRYCASSNIDSRGLNHIENIVKQHYQLLSKSNTYITNLHGQIPTLRIYKLIQDKIQRDRNASRPSNLSSLMLLTHYDDFRINRLFKTNLTFFNNRLRTSIAALRPNNSLIIDQHIDSKLPPNPTVVSNAEVLSFLITKYAYFLRNTLFHGAVDEPSFTLGTTQEQKELKMASEWLENLIKDLLDNQLL